MCIKIVILQAHQKRKTIRHRQKAAAEAKELRPLAWLPLEVCRDRSFEHTKSRYRNCHQSTPCTHGIISSRQISWDCWVLAALFRQLLTNCLSGVEATLLVCCTWHFPQQLCLLNTKRKPTTLKNSPLLWSWGCLACLATTKTVP